MSSVVPNSDAGLRQSRAVRSAKAERFLWQVRDGIIKLARAGELGWTLKERAAQLTALGVRTSRGNAVDEFKLSVALRSLGADANAIKGWLLKAQDAADLYDVDDATMVYQLWHEWLYHESICWVERGMSFSANSDHPFKFVPIAPDKWLEPSTRGVARRHDFVMASPPAARLVYALFGMFAMEPPAYGGYSRPLDLI